MNDRAFKVLEYHKVIDRLAEFSVSKRGKEIIKELKPHTNKEKIKKLLDETDESVRLLLSRGSIPLEGFYDVRYIIKKAKIGSTLNLSDLLQIAATLRVVKQIKKYINEVTNIEEFNIICTIIKQLEDLVAIEKEITRCVISPEDLADDASHELFVIRRQINRKNQNIREKLNSMITSSTYQKYLQDQIVTIRQDRYVIPVKQEYRGNVKGIIHDQSSTGATLFIEPMAIVELNNDLKKLKLQEVEEIERILREFTLKISLVHDEIYCNVEMLLKLDIIFAKGKFALHIKGTYPCINDEMYLNIKKARHPLIDKDVVVSSDIYLGKDFKTLIITGPNTGGKTVALKTIGLLCLMMQTGLFITANDNSSMCIHQGVFADIGDEQSIEQSLSTFSSHMTNIVGIIDNIKKDSLVLLDELGAGTDPTEGAALAMAIIDYLHTNNLNSVVTTHYSELKQYAISEKGIENASVEFDVKTLSPTYKLLIGIPGKSNAFEISNKLGLNNKIIQNSKKYLSQEDIRFEDVLKDIENKRKLTDENYLYSKRAKIEADEKLRKIQIEKEAINASKKDVIKKAKEEALNIVKNANDEALSIIKEMKTIKINADVSANRELELQKRKLKDKENLLEAETEKFTHKEKVEKSNKPFKLGDKVLVVKLNQKGYILEVPNEDDIALVEIGIMKIKVNINEMKHVNDIEINTKSLSRKSINNKSKYINNTFDIRGATSEEAIIDIEKYLDDAYLANLNQVTIIHGKGTGVLRETIKKYLKKHPHVKEFRIGNYNEGGTGVTIVTIK
ncbi:MAG: endonuclease MutS2 [Eubacteriaceae bacterium]